MNNIRRAARSLFLYRHKLINQKNAHQIYISACVQANENEKESTDLIELHGKWPKSELSDFLKDMRIIKNFISETEEQQILEEIEPYIKRLRYEFDHWDDAIHGFRETERKHWYPHNRNILDRVRTVAFDGTIMPYVHILDLAEDGVIKPHVDSTRYCGNIISGISLLTACVMRLIRTDENNLKKLPEQTDKKNTLYKVDNDNFYRTQPQTILENNFYADCLLPRRSLYIMRGSARYNFTHEILENKYSIFRGRSVTKQRRVSVICRNEP